MPVKEQVTLESQALYNIALEHINRNRYEKAICLLKKAIRMAPRNPYYLSFLGLCHAQTGGDHAEALAACRRALAMKPRDTVLMVNLGRVQRLAGDNGAAYTTFLEAWKLDRAHPSPAAELSKMGIRRPPVIPFLPRGHWLNKYAGMARARLLRWVRKVGIERTRLVL